MSEQNQESLPAASAPLPETDRSLEALERKKQVAANTVHDLEKLKKEVRKVPSLDKDKNPYRLDETVEKKAVEKMFKQAEEALSDFQQVLQSVDTELRLTGKLLPTHLEAFNSAYEEYKKLSGSYEQLQDIYLDQQESQEKGDARKAEDRDKEPKLDLSDIEKKSGYWSIDLSEAEVNAIEPQLYLGESKDLTQYYQVELNGKDYILRIPSDPTEKLAMLHVSDLTTAKEDWEFYLKTKSMGTSVFERDHFQDVGLDGSGIIWDAGFTRAHLDRTVRLKGRLEKLKGLKPAVKKPAAVETKPGAAPTAAAVAAGAASAAGKKAEAPEEKKEPEADYGSYDADLEENYRDSLLQGIKEQDYDFPGTGSDEEKSRKQFVEDLLKACKEKNVPPPDDIKELGGQFEKKGNFIRSPDISWEHAKERINAWVNSQDKRRLLSSIEDYDYDFPGTASVLRFVGVPDSGIMGVGKDGEKASREQFVDQLLRKCSISKVRPPRHAMELGGDFTKKGNIFRSPDISWEHAQERIKVWIKEQKKLQNAAGVDKVK